MRRKGCICTLEGKRSLRCANATQISQIDSDSTDADITDGVDSIDTLKITGIRINSFTCQSYWPWSNLWNRLHLWDLKKSVKSNRIC